MVELLEIRESIDGWLDHGSVYIRGVPRVQHEANTNAFDRNVPTGMLWTLWKVKTIKLIDNVTECLRFNDIDTESLVT